MIVSKVRKVIAVQCNGPTIRFRVSISIVQPFRRLLMIEHDEEDELFYLQYDIGLIDPLISQ